MTKLKFLLSLHEKLSKLPEDDVQERLSFYSEMIEDRMEEGLSEEDAVLAVGTVDNIASQIIAELVPDKSAVQKARAKKAPQSMGDRADRPRLPCLAFSADRRFCHSSVALHIAMGCNHLVVGCFCLPDRLLVWWSCVRHRIDPLRLSPYRCCRDWYGNRLYRPCHLPVLRVQGCNKSHTVAANSYRSFG